MSRATWAPLAQIDLARIDDFNARRDLDYADLVGRAAIAAGNFLADFPAAGPIVDRNERKWRVPDTDYVLIYRIVPHGVEILRVYHGRENWRKQS
ncbi:type II toxin-antitoxin system RelE/ParE family toxin [Sphingomonas faeni]|uniref:type II toxin-antitoxin system RelE/ParE family toxin n=1 Tax=Sphingomonas faeni TaxID=185950 RepID=UPI0020C0612A|nr:type II toxin-antitoxin system RelE/ParE family toxin [Sphingomonas faeni]MCK8457989.1 type II toxin-antitoxin system RelE/ParE family toxin [Sphingomonas faeni]